MNHSQIAAEIARSLFTDGMGNHANRLVLETGSRKFEGLGLAETVVRDRIADGLAGLPLLQWVSYQDRKPTEADADDYGNVAWSNGVRSVTDSYTSYQPEYPFWHALLKIEPIQKPDKARTEFEALCADLAPAFGVTIAFNRNAAGKYLNGELQECWEKWQAARKEQQP